MNLVGKTLGQFEIVQELGRGGMGTVFKAYQPSLHRFVAIKVLAPMLAQDMDLVKRFLREAQAAAALRHPNIVTIHDVGSEGDYHFIVMEFVEGMSLADLMVQESAMPIERILHILRQVASALDYAHSKGFVHRDIKPSNIMVSPERQDHTILMDFGLVRATSGSRLTRTGMIMGTAEYMSPEQAQGEAVDRRADIYSLGIMVYQMFTGVVPFSKPTPHAILMAHIMQDPPPMSAINRQISPQIEAVVRKTIAKNPNDRYEWAGDMVSDLETAVKSPDRFVAPPVKDSMYGPPTKVVSPGPPTPPPGSLTLPQGSPVYVPGQTPAPGYAYPVTPLPAAVAVAQQRGKLIWGITIGVFLLLLAAAGLIVYPLIANNLRAAETATAIARLPSPTPAVEVELFSIAPTEIVQGESIIIRWRVLGVESISIAPGVLENTEPIGTITYEPNQTTTFELILPNGEKRSQEVRVKPSQTAPVIEYFTVTPSEQVRGRQVELAWKISGTTTQIEISVNYQPRFFDLEAEGHFVETFDKSAILILVAYNGDQKSTKTIDLTIVEPTATPTITPTPLPTATYTPEPTSTPTPTPPPSPTPTRGPTPTGGATPAVTKTSPPTSGALLTFEQFGTWKRGDQPYGTLAQTTEQVKSGSYAAKLAYDFSPATADDDFVVFSSITSVSGQPNLINLWVYGDGSGHFVNVWIQDAAGEVWSVHLGKVGGASWQKMSGAIDPKRPWPSGRVYGPDNGVIDYPIKFYGIVLDRPGSGPKTGSIYLDDLSFGQYVPEAGATATVEAGEPPIGEVGRIVFTVQVDKLYYLYSTDPTWNKMVKIGDTDYGNSTCSGRNSTITLDGITVNLRPVNKCDIAGTVGSCMSPNGQYKANTNQTANGFSVTLWRVSDNKIIEAYYEGPLNIAGGINWSPDSSHFLFTVNQSLYRCDVGKAGYYQVIPFKDKDWPLQYSPDGSLVYYLKPVNGAISDIFAANPDGSNERNLTNAPISIKLCPRWKN